MAKLTTTSYALLGLLARSPWSAYELNKYMQWSALRRIWPRAESRIYEEPKKLVAQGLANAREEFQGARKRTVYRITAKGRRALATWLGQPSAELTYEYETLVKLINGDHCDESTLDKLVAEVRQQAKDEAQALMEGCEVIIEQGWRIGETAEHNAWVIHFMRTSIEARLRWADDIEEKVKLRRQGRREEGEARARQWYREEVQALQTLLAE